MWFLQHSGTRVTPSVRVPETGPREEVGNQVPKYKCPWKLEASSHRSRARTRAPVISPQWFPGQQLFLVGGRMKGQGSLFSPVSEAMVGHAGWWHSPLPNPESWGGGSQEPPPVPGAPFASILGCVCRMGELGEKTARTLYSNFWGRSSWQEVDGRPSAVSDPRMSLILWVKPSCEHWMCAAITELNISVTGKGEPSRLSWAQLPPAWPLEPQPPPLLSEQTTRIMSYKEQTPKIYINK